MTRPWLIVAPLATLGILVGHELAYALAGAVRGETHGYLQHLPQIGLIFVLLSFAAASFTQRTQRLALWPFPAVAVGGFVIQEHVERLQHEGSLPFLLDQPFFLIGVVVQCAVALAIWLFLRVLISTVGCEPTTSALSAQWTATLECLLTPLLASTAPQVPRSRGPPSRA